MKSLNPEEENLLINNMDDYIVNMMMQYYNSTIIYDIILEYDKKLHEYLMSLLTPRTEYVLHIHTLGE